MATQVTHVIGQLGRGGAEKQLFRLAAALQKRGWQQSIVAFSPGGVWADRFREVAIPLFMVPRSPIKPWRFWQLLRLVRRVKPRVIVSWSEHVAVYVDRLFAVGRVKRIITVRGDLTKRNGTGAPKRQLGLLRRALERADYVVSNSQRNLDALRQRGVRLPPAEVIYNIVAEGKTPFPPRTAEVPRIVAIGSLFPLKSYDVLIEAMAILAANATDCELLLAGRGGEQPRLESLANQLGVAERVKFLGDVEDVPGLLHTADVFAHPAITEGLSNAILEALAEGLPVVACPVRRHAGDYRGRAERAARARPSTPGAGPRDWPPVERCLPAPRLGQAGAGAREGPLRGIKHRRPVREGLSAPDGHSALTAGRTL